MTIQSAANVLVFARRETTAGVISTATGATQVRLIASPGLELKRALVQSKEKRDDGVAAMPRLSAASVDGSYTSELSVGGHVDLFLEAAMRSTWSTATTVAMVSVAITTNALTQTSGDWVGTSGLRVGDIFTITGAGTSAVNNLRVPITALTSLTLTVPAGTFVTCTVTGTLTRLKKLTTATSPTRYSHTIEQFEEDITQSERFVGCRIVGMRLSLKPGQMSTVQYRLMGFGHSTAGSQYFTSPTVTTGLSLVSDDSSILKSGVVVGTFTGIDLDFTIAAKPENVIGSSTPVDIVDNDMTVTGTITGLRSDLSDLATFDAETEFEIQIVLTEPTSAPKPCFAGYFPRVKISALSAPVGGDDGAKIETLGLVLATKVAATGYDATVANWGSSAP